MTANKLFDAEAGKLPFASSSDKQQAIQKKKKEEDDLYENKVLKLTYIQAIKVEIRVSRELDQLDFNNIEMILTEGFMNDKSCKINFKTDIISQELTYFLINICIIFLN